MRTTRSLVFILFVGGGALVVTGCSRWRSSACCDPCSPAAAPKTANVFKPRLPGERPKQKRTPLPAKLVGKWTGMFNGKKRLIEFTKDGRHYRGGPPLKWKVSADGSTLTYHKTTYKRTSGKGRALLGTWYSAKHKEEFYFRTDGSYTSHHPDHMDYGGTWRVTGSLLSTMELASIVTVTGATITFRIMYMPEHKCSWKVSGTTLTLICSGQKTVWTRL